MQLQECSHTINKMSALGVSPKSKINMADNCPSLLTEKFKDIQLRLYGYVIAKDITNYKIQNFTVIGLYKWSNKQYVNKKNETDKSLWVVQCTCGSFQFVRYSILKDISRGKGFGSCNKCSLKHRGEKWMKRV